MIPECSQHGDSKLSKPEPSVSEIKLQEQVKETLRELYDLLEQYAPSWYPEQLREKAVAVLQLLEK